MTSSVINARVALAACAVAVEAMAFAAGPKNVIASSISQAVANPARPASDTARDADRNRSKRSPSSASTRGTVADYVAD